VVRRPTVIARMSRSSGVFAKAIHGSILFQMQHNLLNYGISVDIKKSFKQQDVPLLYIRNIDKNIG
jgi:hypothetical protein